MKSIIVVVKTISCPYLTADTTTEKALDFMEKILEHHWEKYFIKSSCTMSSMIQNTLSMATAKEKGGEIQFILIILYPRMAEESY